MLHMHRPEEVGDRLSITKRYTYQLQVTPTLSFQNNDNKIYYYAYTQICLYVKIKVTLKCKPHTHGRRKVLQVGGAQSLVLSVCKAHPACVACSI